MERGREIHWSRRLGKRKAAGGRESGGRKGKQGKEAWGEVGSVIAHSMQVTPPTLMRLR